MMHLNESMELARAKQVKVEEEKESIRYTRDFANTGRLMACFACTRA